MNPIGSKLHHYALILAILAFVLVHLGLALIVFGGGFYSTSFLVFIILIWIGFPTSLIALLLAIYSLSKVRTFEAALSILVCLSLYASYVLFGLIQSPN